MKCHLYLSAGILSCVLGAACSHVARAAEEKGKEEDEQKVAIADVPAPVRKTLEREANGQSVKTVDKEKQKGKTVYEADVKIDGHNYEIVVAEDGTLLSKALDEEDEKDEAKEPKGGKSEHKAEK